MTLHPDWLVPQWPAPAGVQAVCTTRAGGQSDAPFDGLNLALHVGDEPSQVAASRAALGQAVGAKLVFMNQVHGKRVAFLDDRVASGDAAALELDPANPDPLTADAAATRQRGLACTVMVADCLPVLLCSTDGAWVAAAHAGWRGLAGTQGFGVLEAAVQSFWVPNRSASHDALALPAIELIAWLGPCIGPSAFEVGPEVRAAFMASAPDSSIAACFAPQSSGKYLADLAQLARLRLAAVGVNQVFGNDSTAPWCTVANPLRYFSYRRDGVTGRMAACIWRA